MLMRIVGVTLGLAAAGFVAGAIVGLAMMGIWLALSPVLGDTASNLLRGAAFGGAVGAVAGPAAAWLLMRHVPLGLAIGGTALGTLAGAALGLLIGGWEGSFGGAFLGFTLVAVALRIRGSRAARAA
jgi:hypothetical protein